MADSLSRIRLIASVALLLPLFSGAPVAVGGVECTVASVQPHAPAGTTIKAAAVVAATDKLPEYCRVDATVATPGNTVDFRLGLPVRWNGKFFFEGVGGFAGAIGSLDIGLSRGYASASTDTGHQGGGTDASWAVNNPAKVIDYGYRGTHVTSVAAKSLTQTFYGSASRYAIFNGCSNGGRQALMEAERFPEDFDGIIAGDPGLGTQGHLKRLLTYQTMMSSPDHVLPAAKLETISKAVLAACDKNDGLADGLISDPRLCHFDPGTLRCRGTDGPDCLTEGQVETVKALYADAKTPLGTIPGFPVGHESGGTGWQAWIVGSEAPVQTGNTLAFGSRKPTGYNFQDGYFRFLAFDGADGTFDWRTFDLKRDGPKLEARSKIMSPTDHDLTKLQKRGGKLLIYHGWADPALSAYGSIAYYNDAVKAAGGHQKADDFVRLFMVPGMHHCSGGPGPNTFDMITALENWLDKATPPTRIVASHATNGVVDRTRPLCPEPQVARYLGSGSIDAAENFRCEAPQGARP